MAIFLFLFAIIIPFAALIAGIFFKIIIAFISVSPKLFLCLCLVIGAFVFGLFVVFPSVLDMQAAQRNKAIPKLIANGWSLLKLNTKAEEECMFNDVYGMEIKANGYSVKEEFRIGLVNAGLIVIECNSGTISKDLEPGKIYMVSGDPTLLGWDNSDGFGNAPNTWQSNAAMGAALRRYDLIP